MKSILNINFYIKLILDNCFLNPRFGLLTCLFSLTILNASLYDTLYF